MHDRRIDTVAGPPDHTRPRNPWPRLLLFFIGVVGAVFLVGYCTMALATPPPREVRVPLNAIEPGLPRFVPVTIFGSDRDGNTYGAWVTWDGATPQAFLSRQPETLCHLGWNATYRDPDVPGESGAFVDRCGDAVYAFTGDVAHDTARKDLDVFPARIDGREIVVDIMRLRLGECRAPGAEACSPPDETREVRMPRDRLPEGFATEH